MPGGSGLRRLPDRVANHDRFWNKTKLEEAIGHTLLGRNDVIGDRANGKGRAVGGDGLDIKRNAAVALGQIILRRDCGIFIVEP